MGETGQQNKPLNYMGIDKEGKFVTAVSGTLLPKELAKEVAKMLRQGLSVERCDDEYVRQHFGDKVR